MPLSDALEDWYDRRERIVLRAFGMEGDEYGSRAQRDRDPIKFILAILNDVAVHANGGISRNDCEKSIIGWMKYHDPLLGWYFVVFEAIMVVIVAACVIFSDPSGRTLEFWSAIVLLLVLWTTWLLWTWYRRHTRMEKSILQLMRREDESVQTWLSRANYAETFAFYPNGLLRSVYEPLETST